MQTSLAKKLFAVGSAAALALSLFAPFAAQAAAHSVGTNVSSSDGTVWMVMPDGTRRAYTSAGAFLSYGFNSWSQVVPASAEDLTLPAGAFIPPQDGTVFCATETKGSDVKGECSLVTAGTKAAFTSAAVFTGLGFSFARAQYGDSSFLGKSSNIDNTTAAHRTGVLVNNNGTVQLVGASGLLGIPDLSTFNSWGYSFANVVPANASDKTMVQTGVMAGRMAGQLSPSWTTSPGPGPGQPPPPPPSGGGLSVSLSGSTPPSASVATGAAFLPFTAINFTAAGNPVTITGLKVHRMGLGADNNINNMYLFNGGMMIAQSSSFQSGVVSFTNSNGLFTVAANSTMTVWVKGDLASGSGSGLTYGFGLASASDVMSNATSVSGSFPLSGNLMTSATVSSPSLATLTVAAVAVGTSINAGTPDVLAGQWSLTSANSAIQIKGVSLTMIGSAAASGFANMKLMAAGAQVGSTIAAMPSNKVIFFDLSANPLNIPTGQTVQLQLKADIVSEVNRTYQFSIQHNYDIQAYDTTYNVGILSGSTFPLNSPTSAATINAGTLSITRSADSRTTSVVASMTNVKLASFDFTAYGEDVKLLNLPISIVMGAGAATITNIKLVDNQGVGIGTQVTSAAGVTTTAYTNTFGSSSNLNYVISANTTRKLSIVADITSANASATTIAASLTAGSSNAQGVTSVSSISTSAASGNALTVATSTFTATVNTALASPVKIVPGGTNLKLASFSLKAGGADAVNVTTITISTASASVASNVQNMKVMIGSTQIGQIQPTLSNSATYSFSPSSAIMIPAGGSVAVDVFADIISSASSGLFNGHVVFTLTTGVTAQLASSGTSVSLSANISGQTVTTAGNGVITISKDPSSPQSRQVAMGQTGVVLGVLRFQETSNNEAVTLTDITVSATAISGTPQNGSASTSSSSLTNFVITDGTTTYTQIAWSSTTANNQGEATATGATPSRHVVTFNNVNFTVPAGGTLKLTVKADTNAFASGGASGAQFAVGINATSTDVTLRGQQSQATLANAALTSFALSATTTVVRSTVSIASVSSIPSGQPGAGTTANATGITGTSEIVGVFAVTASTAGDVQLNTLTLRQGGSAPTGAAVPYSIYDSSVDTGTTVQNTVSNLTGTTAQAQTFGTAIQITAGQTKYLVVRASTSAFNTQGTGAPKTFNLDVTAWTYSDGSIAPYTVVANSADAPVPISAIFTTGTATAGRTY